MIRYTLRCAEGHKFDSWFQSASAFDKLLGVGMVNCAVCGSTDVSKAVMAPSVSSGAAEAEPPADRPLSGEKSPSEQALARFRSHLEKHSDYVGSSFAQEARAIHEGDAPERLIHGEAKRDEAIKLLEDGIPVSPLPFVMNRKTN